MTWIVRVGVLLALGLAAWQVHSVRAIIAAEDEDPVATANLTAKLQSIPLELLDGEYRGVRQAFDDDTVRASGADLHASTIYSDRSGNRFELYVGGSIKNQENFHAPSYCMPAAGWEVLEQTTVPFEVYADPRHAPRMRRLLLQRGSQKMIVYYWFQAGGRVADHEWTVRYYRFLDLLADQPLRPTLIVAVYAGVRTDVARTEKAIASFLRAVGPTLEETIGQE
jgi:EpsI family protein